MQCKVENSICGWQPTGIGVPSAAGARADELTSLMVIPDVSVGHEELPALGALAWEGSMQRALRRWTASIGNIILEAPTQAFTVAILCLVLL